MSCYICVDQGSRRNQPAADFSFLEITWLKGNFPFLPNKYNLIRSVCTTEYLRSLLESSGMKPGDVGRSFAKHLGVFLHFFLVILCCFLPRPPRSELTREDLPSVTQRNIFIQKLTKAFSWISSRIFNGWAGGRSTLLKERFTRTAERSTAVFFTWLLFFRTYEHWDFGKCLKNKFMWL